MITFVLILVAVLGALWIENRNRRHYRGRSCAGRFWRRDFPDAPKDQIHLFLDCLIGGMGFPRSFRLKFEPSDRALAVCRSLYGGETPLSDSLECENFLMNLSKAFGVEPEALITQWHETVTLGELFSFVSRQGRAAAEQSLEGTVIGLCVRAAGAEDSVRLWRLIGPFWAAPRLRR